MSEIGKYIKQLRESKKYSQRKLSYLSHVSNATINRAEKGTAMPEPDTLRKLSGPLGVPYEKLMDTAGYLFPIRENTPGDQEYSINNNSNKPDEAKDNNVLSHIKDKELREWVESPTSTDYLMFAKKVHDLGIDPDFILTHFIYGIFKNKKRK